MVQRSPSPVALHIFVYSECNEQLEDKYFDTKVRLLVQFYGQ